MWCNIHKAIRHMEEINIDWNTLFRLIPGRGLNILFWNDIWCGNSPFQDRFLAIYHREKVKCCRLEDWISANGFTGNWNQYPNDAITLNELWRLYPSIGLMDIPPQSSFGFKFMLNPDGHYIMSTL